MHESLLVVPHVFLNEIILQKKCEGVTLKGSCQNSPHAASTKSPQKSGAIPANIQGNLGLTNDNWGWG